MVETRESQRGPGASSQDLGALQTLLCPGPHVPQAQAIHRPAEFEKVRARAQALESGKSGVWSQPHNLLHQVTWPQPAWTADL